MATEIDRLNALLKQLPPEARAELSDFAEALVMKHRVSNGQLKQNWAGALQDCRGQFTSLDLQKKSLEWRGD